MIRNIIFDWSGTLVDDLPAVLGATNGLLRDAGFPELSRDEFRARFRLPYEEFYREFQGVVPIADLERQFHHHFESLQNSVSELPHARAFLEFCRLRAVRTLVLSTVPEPYYRTQAQRHGFASFIDHPFPGVRDKRTRIADILDSLGLNPSETLFIGDMQHDVDTARHGGIWSCAVLTGYNRLDQLRASRPDLIVEHLGELRGILDRNNMHIHPVAGLGDDSLPVPTVGALIFDSSGCVLLIRTRKWSNLWGIPGGKIQSGESAHAALLREVKEETDLDLCEVRFVLVQDCIHSSEFYRKAHFVLLNYTARRVGSNPVVLNDEAEEFCWLPIDRAFELPLNQPTRTLIESVLAGQPSLIPSPIPVPDSASIPA